MSRACRITLRWIEKAYLIRLLFIDLFQLNDAGISYTYTYTTGTREQVNTLQGGPKKLHTVFMAITLSTLNHFSYFWHIDTVGNLQLNDA